PHGTRSSKKFIGDGGRGQGDLHLTAQFERKLHVFLHHIDVEPRFVRHLENEWPAILQHGRSSHGVQQYFHRSFSWNSTLLREQQPFGVCEYLHRQRKIRRDLHHERQAIFADESDLGSKIEQ